VQIRLSVLRVGLITTLSVLAASGCGPAVQTPSAPVDTHALELQQAHDGLDRWAQAFAAQGPDQLSIPLREGTQVIGDLTEPQRKALMSGAVALSGQPTPFDFATFGPYPAGSAIAWPDGDAMPVTALSAGLVLARIAAEGDRSCEECEQLYVIGIAPTTTQIATSRGPATAPAWRFTLFGTSAVLVRVALADPVGTVSPTPPPWDAVHPPAGLSIESGFVSADDRRLRVRIVVPNTAPTCPAARTTRPRRWGPSSPWS
jgi:hypothetical protein